MAAFGDDAIAVVTNGLRRSTGTFEERLVSHGLVGDITLTVVSVVLRIIRSAVRAAVRAVTYAPREYPS